MKIMTLILMACLPNGGFFSGLPGRYTLALRIGTHVFKDKLEITSVTRHPGMASLTEFVSGVFTSPEAGLSSPLTNGIVKVVAASPGELPQGFELNFEINVTENGRTFPVYFTVSGPTLATCSNLGVAYFDPEKTKPLGSFVMTKDTRDCDCVRL